MVSPTGEQVVNPEADEKIKLLQPRAAGRYELKRTGQKRRAFKHRAAFGEAVANLFELPEIEFFDGLLKVSHPAVNEPGAFRTRTGSKIVGLHEGHFQPAHRRIKGATGSRRAAANNKEIKFFGRKSVETGSAIHEKQVVEMLLK